MEAFLPTSPLLGNLEIVDVYEYYDGPRLFACRNATGQTFLGLWVGDSDGIDRFWYVPLSQDRFRAVRSGGIDLRSAFLTPETGSVLRVEVRRGGNECNVSPLSPSQLPADLLPVPGESLRVITETLPRADDAELQRKATALRREVVNLHLDFPTMYRTEAPTRRLGKVLDSFQEMLDSLGQVRGGVPTPRGSIPPAILEATDTVVLNAYAASFAVQIAAAHEANLLGSSLVADVLDELTSLLSVGDNASSLRERLVELKSRAAGKYKTFLRTLVDSETGIRIAWGSVDPNRGRSVSLSQTSAKAAINIVEEVTSELAEVKLVVGLFRAVDLGSKRYEIYVPAEDVKYRGRIMDGAMPQAEHLTLNRPYRITLREVVEVTSSGEEKVKDEIERIEISNSDILDSRVGSNA